MSAWEDIGSTYAEAATKAFPLHRAVVFACGFLASVSIQKQSHLSIFETMAVVPLPDFVTLDKGFFAGATGANVLWSISAAVLAVILSKLLIRLAYSFVDRATGATERAIRLDRAWLAGLTIEDRKSALELLESGLVEPRSRLRGLSGINELLLGLSLIFGVAAFWGNLLDGFVCLGTSIAAIYLHFKSIQIFLADYYGTALAKAQLQGKPPPKIDNMS